MHPKGVSTIADMLIFIRLSGFLTTERTWAVRLALWTMSLVQSMPLGNAVLEVCFDTDVVFSNVPLSIFGGSSCRLGCRTIGGSRR